jgi:hypothetical protein
MPRREPGNITPYNYGPYVANQEDEDSSVDSIEEPKRPESPKPITLKEIYAPPEQPPPKKEKEYFRDQLERAVMSEEWHAQSEDFQRAYVHYIFDQHPDERVRSLDPGQRQEYMQLTLDDFQRDGERARSMIGQWELSHGGELYSQEGSLREDYWNFVENTPLQIIPRFWRKFVETGVAGVIEGLEGKAEDFVTTPEEVLSIEAGDSGAPLLDWLTGPETPEQAAERQVALDEAIRRTEKWDLLDKKAEQKIAEKGTLMQTVLFDIMKRSDDKQKLSEQIRELAERTPLDLDVAQLDTILDGKGMLAKAARATEVAANAIVDSLAFMAPAMVTGNPMGFYVGMQTLHQGMQLEEARAEGVELAPGTAAISGAAQAGLSVIGGAEAAIMNNLRRTAPKFIDDLLKSGLKRGSVRAGTGMTMEGMEEFAQEWINQQVPEWSKGNQGIWSNLSADEKKEIIHGALLAPIAAGPFEAISAVKEGRRDRFRGKVLKLQDRRDKTPEQRGAERKLSLPPDVDAKEREDQVRFEMAPAFLQEDETRMQEWVERGYTVPQNEEEHAAMSEANRAIHEELYGAVPTRVETESSVGRRVLDAIKRHTLKAADKADEDKKPLKATGYRHTVEAGDVRLVEPTDAPEHEWMREEQAYADSLGTTLVFYDADGPLASRGMFTQEGVIAVRYQPKGQQMTAASIMLHELIHNMDKRSPSISKALADLVAETFPDEWAEIEETVKDIEERTGWAQHDSEKLAYFSERYARDIFQTMAAVAENPELAQESRGLRKAYETFVDILVNLVQKFPKLAETLGLDVTPEELRENDLAVAKVARAFAEALAETAEGAQPKIKTTPVTKEEAQAKKQEQKQKGTPVKDLKRGDTIQITKAIGGTVTNIGPVAKDGTVAVELDTGESHVLGQDVLVRVKASSTPGKTTKATPEEVEKKLEEPAEAPSISEDLLPKRLDKATLQKKKESRKFKRALRAAANGDWDEVTPEEFHTALNGNIGAVTLTPYTVDDLSSPDFKLFRLRGTDIYFAMNAKDAVGLVNNDLEDLPGIAAKASMVKAIEEGAETADCFAVITPSNPQGFLPERYARYGWRMATTEEMPQWAQDIGGRAGVLPFSEEAYLEEHSAEDLALARRYWKEQGATTDPDVVFLIWDPLPGVTRENARKKAYDPGDEFGTKAYSDRMWERQAESVVDEIQASVGDYRVVSQEGNTYTLRIEMKNGEETDAIFRHRFEGTEDEDIYFDWIGENRPGEPPKGMEVFGMRGVLWIGRQLREQFPGAKWVSGNRAGGVHNEAVRQGKDHNPLRRLKLDPSVEGEPKSEDQLLLIYGLGEFYNSDWTDQYEDVELDPDVAVAIEEGYDEDPDVLFIEDMDNDDAAELIEYLKSDASKELDDVFSSEEVFVDEIDEWGEKEWSLYGDKHGVPNLGGMRPMQKHGAIELPGGGVEGTFTYQELIWIKAQAIDPNEAWTEDEHVQFQRKLARTLTPAKDDTLGALNNLLFSMISPSTNLTENEIAYALLRIENEAEIDEWLELIPWDVTQGESAGWAAYQALSEADRKDFHGYLKTYRKGNPKTMPKRLFKKRMKQWVDRRVREHFGLKAEDKGGIGIGISADLSHIPEMLQFYKVDPEWFLIGEGESWYHFVNRLQSQLGGLSAKTAAFGVVWQDPLYAAVAAIDRHMAFVFREEIFTSPIERKAFEDEVLAKWRADRKDKGKEDDAQSIDDIISIRGGQGFVTNILLEKISRPILRKYNLDKHSFEFLRDPEQVQLMSKYYLRALRFNAREAERLDLGVFATQHLLWDRQRRRVEPHAVNFPGLYKLPKMTMNQLRAVLKKYKEYGFTGTKKVWVDDEFGGREERLSRARSAPPGELAYASTPPGAYSEGTRQGVASSLFIQPSADLNEDGGDMWIVPDETKWGWFMRKIQDKFRRVSEVQKAIEDFVGVNLRDDLDIYMHELLYHGRAANRIRKFESDYVQPLLDYLREQGIEIADLEQHLHALHAEERNRHFRETYYDRYKLFLETTIAGLEGDIELAQAEQKPVQMLKRRLNRMRRKLAKIDDISVPTAGMTDQEAAEILEGNGTRYDGAVELFKNMQSQKLIILSEAGMISDETLELVSKYQNYVPLKGKNHEGDLDELFFDTGLGSGRGFDIRGDELGYSYGRKEGDTHKNPILAQSILDVTKAIIRAEKNRVGQSLLALAREYPNPDLWEVDKVVKRRVWSKKEQQVKFVEDEYAKQLDNVFAVNEGGQTFYITLKDARLAEAMKNLGSEQIGAFVKMLGAANRFLAKINTTFNAEFIVSNFIRDLQTALVHLQDQDAQGLMAQTMANLPAALRGIAGAELDGGFGRTEWTDKYEDFQEAGGQIGWTGYDDVLTMAADLQKSIDREGPGMRRMTFRRLLKLGRMIEAGNTVVENGIRLATYQTAVDAGLSKERAAVLARRLTVNFNKKGEIGGIINSIWLFSNANIQGNARMIQALWRSRRVRGIAGGMVMLGFLQGLLARGMGGEDEEDGYSYWEKIPDWIKETNHVVMIPGSEGDYFKLPMSYGYNVFFVLGQQIEKLYHNTVTGTFQASDVPKAAGNFAASTLSAFSPTGAIRMDSSWGIARPVVPSVAAPVFDSLVNETYYGAPILPVRSSWDKSPDSQRHFASASKASQDLTKWANKLTGGNAYQPGAIDVSPETIDYMVSSYSGGGGQTAKRVLWDAPRWLWKSWDTGDMKKPEANDVAFLRRVYGEQNDHTVASVFYDSVEEIEQAEAAWENLRKDPKFDRRSWQKRHGWKRQLFKPLSDAQKKIRKAETQERKNKIRKDFNRRYREAWESQF